MQNKQIEEAAKYCRENKTGLLAPLLQTSVNPNSLVARFRYGAISRRKVPLLAVCVAHNALDCLQLLIYKCHANIECEDGSGMRPVHWACALNREHALNILLDAGALVDPIENPMIMSPFLFCARYGALECLQRLIRAGVDVNQQDGGKRTALHLACWFGHDRLIQVLLRARARVEAIDEMGKTALHHACWFGHMACCNALIEADAPLDAQDICGWSALHFAVRHNRPEIVRALVQAGASTKLKNVQGQTAESIASSEELDQIVQILDTVKKVETNSGSGGSRSVSEFVQEHNILKDAVRRLAIGRDAQLEQFNSLKDRIDSEQAKIEVLQSDQMELQREMNQLHGQLNYIFSLLKAIQEKNRVVTGPKHHICRMCNKNEAVVRCRSCHSQICASCQQQIKQTGCPFCRLSAQ